MYLTGYQQIDPRFGVVPILECTVFLESSDNKNNNCLLFKISCYEGRLYTALRHCSPAALMYAMLVKQSTVVNGRELDTDQAHSHVAISFDHEKDKYRWMVCLQG